MKPLHNLLAVFALTLALLPQVGIAQTTTFDNEADWLAALCPDSVVVEEEFNFEFNGETIPDDSLSLIHI